MRKKSLAVLTIFLILACRQVVAAESLAGEWHGSANTSALPFSLSAAAKFNENGTFSISLTSFLGVICLKVNGAYIVSDGTIAMKPTSFDGLFASQLVAPELIGTASLSYTLRDGKLTIVGNAMGLDGTLSLLRR